jgi:hypothetical protein
MGLHVHLDQVFLDNAKKTVIKFKTFYILLGSRNIKKEQFYYQYWR